MISPEWEFLHVNYDIIVASTTIFRLLCVMLLPETSFMIKHFSDVFGISPFI